MNEKNQSPQPKPALLDPGCNPHPDAPHGFNRNASHNAGRYVCDCESWQADDDEYVQMLMDRDMGDS